MIKNVVKTGTKRKLYIINKISRMTISQKFMENNGFKCFSKRMCYHPQNYRFVIRG